MSFSEKNLKSFNYFIKYFCFTFGKKNVSYILLTLFSKSFPDFYDDGKL